MADHKDHQSVGALIAIDSAETRTSLIQAFAGAELPAPKQAANEAELRQQLAAGGLDLIVMGSKLAGVYVAPLISEVRRGKLGPHPFPIVVVLTEESGKDALRQVSNCGPDEIVPLPCEPDDLLSRINVFLSGDRRPLVVNAGYAGPERRTKSRE